jgi:hypothetical protein
MAGNFMFANLFTCANVSRVLETNPKVYESVVHPVTGGAGEPYVNAFYNFRHEFDPFPMVRPFAPVGWGENYVLEEKCEKILQFNVHGINHYLDDPRVHVPMLRALIGDDAVVTEAERVAATAQYDAKEEPQCIAVVQKFKTTAANVIALAKTGADPEALVIAGTQFLAASREAIDACQQE